MQSGTWTSTIPLDTPHPGTLRISPFAAVTQAKPISPLSSILIQQKTSCEHGKNKD